MPTTTYQPADEDLLAQQFSVGTDTENADPALAAGHAARVVLHIVNGDTDAHVLAGTGAAEAKIQYRTTAAGSWIDWPATVASYTGGVGQTFINCAGLQLDIGAVADLSEVKIRGRAEVTAETGDTHAIADVNDWEILVDTIPGGIIGA